MVTPLVTRILSKVEPQPNGCWMWTGAVYWNGYGAVRDGGRTGRTVVAHRALYVALVGPVPDDLLMDHTCHDPDTCPGGVTCPHRRCVNPDHQEPVTHIENVRRGAAGPGRRSRTHCADGHPITVSAAGKRLCEECHRQWSRRSNTRKAS